jgi:phage terminase large subunit
MTDDPADSPAWFAFRHLGLDLYQWQVEALEDIGRGVMGGQPPTSLVASNGSGKTQRVIAASILWFLWRYPRGTCPITSGSWMQVEKQLFPALQSFRGNPLFRKWTFNQTEIKTDQGGQAVGFSTDNPGRAEGWHPRLGQDIDPVYYVVDEAKTVPDGIFEAIGRCTLRFHLKTSSPGGPRGNFYRSQTSEASLHRVVKATSFDCAHIDPLKIERDKRLYGEDHPIYRSMHLAEFTEDADRLVLSAGQLTTALAIQPEIDTNGETVAFCDFAAGRDENALAIRRGNRVRLEASWKEPDTMQAVREFINLFKRHNLKAGQIWGDADGMGTVFCDALAEQGWRINRFHGGQAPSEKAEYANLISEVWHVGAREIERGRINLGQLDPTTFEQLTTRKSEWAENGKLRLESKEKMRAKGIKSPDRADTIMGCIGCGARLSKSMTADAVIQSKPSPFRQPIVKGFASI